MNMKGPNMEDENYEMKENYDFSKGRRGLVIPPRSGKTKITIRIDDDILSWFREKANGGGGGNYQSIINAALREHINMGRRQARSDSAQGDPGRIAPFRGLNGGAVERP